MNDAKSLKTKPTKKASMPERKYGGGLSGMLVKPESLRLPIDSLPRGIDNYRVDVQLSPKFVFRVGEVIDELLLGAIEAKSTPTSKHPIFESLRASYFDMMSILIHRTRTDLSAHQVLFLQFAIVKHILQEVRNRLDQTIARLQESASQQKIHGSAKMLRTHEQTVRLRKHYNSILYRTNQQIFKQLARQETSHLQFDRKRCLGELMSQSVDIMFNPMLHAQSPDDHELLFQHYALWSDHKGGFAELNGVWEKIVRSYSDFGPVSIIKSGARVEATRTAVFDELGGLFAVQTLLGFAEEQKGALTESLSWMEEPENIRALFDQSWHTKQYADLVKYGGLLSRWKYRRQYKRAMKIFKRMSSYLKDRDRLRYLLSSYELRSLWNRNLSDSIDPTRLCELIASVDSKRSKSLRNALGFKNEVLVKRIQEAAKNVEVGTKAKLEERIIQVLSDLSKYRQHLKYYRFAHRIFNRIAILDSKEDIELAKHGNQLFRLFGETEVEQVESRIVHHAIIKADVRGSTTVTTELVNKGLNPASYFSQRFFDPINELLGTYGAGKVFIEGDAVILSMAEHQDTPQQWYAVSRACGLAREMIQVVASNNAFSERTGLPYLEIGIGICYSDEAPLFLFDDGKPIMISPAIGHADRMSSCSWRMREKHKAGLFNVEVCTIAAGEKGKGEKGQETHRFNVNGILLDEAAIRKLRTEIMLKKINLKIAGEDTVFLAGQFPDVHGKNRNLVIRQAQLGLWKNDKVIRTSKSNEYFYEVVTHQKVLAHVTEKLK